MLHRRIRTLELLLRMLKKNCSASELSQIAEIHCTLKKGESKGLVQFDLWANNGLEVDLFKKQKLEPESSSFHIRWLRDRHGESNPLSLEIPIVFENNAKGAQHIVIDPVRLPFYLDLSGVEIDSQVQANLMHRPTIRVPRQKLDYRQLALSYQAQLESGMFPTRASLARHLGVSRAWVTIVLSNLL